MLNLTHQWDILNMIKSQKKNYRNGSVKKNLKSEFGLFEFENPRDRNGELEPKIVPKNTIELLNRQFRKFTKTKSVFPTDMSLLKCLYLATKNIAKKWDQACRNWRPLYYLNYLLCLMEEFSSLRIKYYVILFK